MHQDYDGIERRHIRHMTDADVEAIATAVKNAIDSHKCQLNITAQEFEEAWPVLRDFANSVTQVKKVTVRTLAGGFALFIIGLVVRGLWQWATDIHNKLGNIINK